MWLIVVTRMMASCQAAMPQVSTVTVGRVHRIGIVLCSFTVTNRELTVASLPLTSLIRRYRQSVNLHDKHHVLHAPRCKESNS